MHRLAALLAMALSLALNASGQEVKPAPNRLQDSVTVCADGPVRSTAVRVNDSTEITYHRPKGYEFITNTPRDFYEMGKRSISKKGLINLGIIAASTATFIALDRPVMNATQRFGRWLGIDPERKFTNAIKFNVGNLSVNFMDLPQNFNSTLYFIGEGWPTMIFTAGMLTHGLIANDNRAILTASQIAECYITMGITVQMIKRLTGRQSPFKTTSGSGEWQLLIKPSKYQSNVPNYDAFPSGHLATLTATVTIYAENYPEIRWIRPVGYTMMGLVGFAMINNGVHWLSDYPLAIAIGYTYGKIVTSRGKTIKFIQRMGKEMNKGSYSLGPTILDNQSLGLAFKLNL